MAVGAPSSEESEATLTLVPPEFAVMSRCESELEKRLARALLAVSTDEYGLALRFREPERLVTPLGKPMDAVYVGRWDHCIVPDFHLTFWQQVQMQVETASRPLRLDFLISGLNVALGIEADGPHHDDPDQQRHDKWRDRQFVGAGIPVIRFTTKELNSNAMECGVEAFNSAVYLNEARTLEIAWAFVVGACEDPFDLCGYDPPELPESLQEELACARLLTAFVRKDGVMDSFRVARITEVLKAMRWLARTKNRDDLRLSRHAIAIVEKLKSHRFDVLLPSDVPRPKKVVPQVESQEQPEPGGHP